MQISTPDAPLATATAFSRLSNESGRALLTVRGQHLVVDSPGVLGGPNEAPNPAELVLCALASCCVFLCETVAQEQQMPLRGVTATAAGDFDPRGVCGDPVDPRFQSFRVRIALDGPDDKQCEALVQAIKRRCPVYTTLSRSASVEIIVSRGAP
jgi:uncharacterized OsmC-like protein